MPGIIGLSPIASLYMGSCIPGIRTPAQKSTGVDPPLYYSASPVQTNTFHAFWGHGAGDLVSVCLLVTAVDISSLCEFHKEPMTKEVITILLRSFAVLGNPYARAKNA